MSNDCPKCGLINAAKARQCDCGYDFETGRTIRSDPESPRNSGGGVGMVLIVMGAIMLVLAGINARAAENISYLIGTFLPGLFALIIGLKLAQGPKREHRSRRRQ